MTDITAQILVNQNIVLNGNVTMRVPSGGTTAYTGTITGAGSIALTSGSTGGGTLALKNGPTLYLPDANETETATLANGVWSVDVTQAMQANQDIVLSPSLPTTLTLPQGSFFGPGSINYTGAISGSGTMIVSLQDSVLTLPGYTLNLGYGDQAPLQQVALTLTNGAWSADFTHELLANHQINLSGAATVEIPSGTTTHTAGLTGAGTLTITAGAGGGTLVMDGHTVTLPDSNQSETFTIASNGTWSTDLTSTLLANADITLTGIASTIRLSAGTTHYTGKISGTGILTLSAASNAASTLIIGSQTFTLPAASEAETLSLSAAGVWSVDVTASILANKAVALTGLATSATLPAGTTTYTGAITGNGPLTITSANAAGGSTFVVGGQALVLASANETETVAFANGTVTTDITEAVLAGQAIMLNGPSALELPAGNVYGSAIGGAGTLVISTSSAGGGTLYLGNTAVFALPDANETETASLSGGVWTVDVSAAIVSGHNITLLPATTTTFALPAGTTNYAGTITGTGRLQVSTGANSGGTLVLANGATVTLPDANETETLVRAANGAWTIDVSAAIAANKDTTLTGTTASAAVGPGITHYVGTITGSGSLILSSGSTGGGSLVLKDGTTFTLPDANETETANFANGKWTVDVTQAMINNQDIVLSAGVPLVVTLPSGNFFGVGSLNYTGTISGSGQLIVYTQDSVLTVPGYTLNLGYGDTAPLQQTILNFANGAWSADFTQDLLANQHITLTGASTLEIPSGTTVHTGGISGAGTLTITSGATGGGRLLLDGQTFVIPGPNQTLVATLGNNGWVVNDTAWMAANRDIDLTGNATVQLNAGTTEYIGQIDGSGGITVTSASNGGSTLVIDGKVAGAAVDPLNLILANANETETAYLANGTWTVDVTAAILANQNITLTTNAFANLPAGLTNYTGKITGAGTLTINGSSGAPATIDFSNSNEPAAFAAGGAGALKIDVSAMIVNNQNIVLSPGIPLVANLPWGTFGGPSDTVYTGTISGSGQLIVSASDFILQLPGGYTLNQVFGDGSPSETTTLTLSNGVWSADFTQTLLANERINLPGPSTVEIPAGTTVYTNSITGSGVMTVTSSATGGGTLVMGATTITLPDASQSQAFTITNGVWSADLTSTVLANGDITLTGIPSTIKLPAGATHYAGTLAGQGSITLVSGSAPSTLVLKDGTQFVLPASGETEVATLANGAWTVDVTAAIQANQPITLTTAAAIELAAGTTTYTGALTGSSPIKLTSANAAGGSTLVIGGHIFTLPSANETETVTLANGVWITDVSAAIAANKNIILGGGTTVATLGAGSSTYIGTISGPGTLVLQASASGPSTITLANNGVTFVLPSAGMSEFATLSAGGTWSVDVSAALSASQAIDLTTNATATVAAGTTTYHGALTGTGVLTLTSSGFPATVVIPGWSSVVLTAADPVETVTVANGVASVDIGAALSASQSIVLAGVATATLHAGTTTDSGTISGAGTLKLTGGAGGGTLVVGAQSFVLPASGETETLTLSGGVWTSDISAAVLANQAVTLTGAATLVLPGGTTTYTGALSGAGTIKVTSPSNGTGTLVVGAATLYFLSPNESQTLTVSNGVITSADVSAAIRANQPIYLSIPTLATISPGTTHYTGSLAGGAPFTLTTGAAGGTLVLADGTIFALPDAHETETFTFANNSWTANATTAFLGNHAITLNQLTTIDLPNGAFTYTGTLTGSAPLTLVSGATGSTVVLGGQNFTLPASTESETLTAVNGVWTADITAAIQSNQAITLTGPTTLVLSGNETYTGSLAGSGTILLSAPWYGASLTIGGTSVDVPSGGFGALATITNGAVTSLDVSKALLGNQNIYLTVPTTVTLPAGTTTYTASISGSAPLTITSSAAGASTLVIGNQSFVLPVANETELLTQSNGVWSVDVTAALLANKAIVLNGATTATLPAGTTIYTGKITGQGSLTVAGNAGAASTLNIGGATSYQLAAGQSSLQTLIGSQWSTDLTQQIIANQNIALAGGHYTMYLTGGGESYTGSFTDNGTLTLVTGPSTDGSLTFKNGSYVYIPGSSTTNVATITNGVVTSVDVSSAFANSDPIWLSMNSTATLASGVTSFNSYLHLDSGVKLTLTGGAGGSTLEMAGGSAVVLGAGVTEVISSVNGVFITDISSVLSGGHPFTLTGQSIATLAAGTTTYNGAIGGTGQVTLAASSNASSTMVLSGTTITLAAGTTKTITLVNGALATDVSAAIAANQAVTLNGAAFALLATGTTTYTGTINGSGPLAVISSRSGASTLSIGGQTFTLPAANETEVLTRASGIWTADLSGPVENNLAIVLNGAAHVQLLAGTETDGATITGAGTLSLTAANTPGGSTLVVGGHSFVLPAAGETETAALSGGVWTTDVTAALLANQPITLSGVTTAALPAGTTTYTGTISGAGTLAVTSGSSGPSTLVIGGQTFSLLAANETETLTLSSAGTWSVDVSTAIAANQPIALSQIPTTATLVAGTTTYAGTISGTGTLALTSSGAGASTLVIGGQSFVLPSANETETLTRSAAGVWSVDITAAMTANQNVTLTGVPTTLSLAHGTINYSGTLAGNGTISASSGPNGSGYFTFAGSKSLYLPDANETNMLTVTNAVVTAVDVTGALLANQDLSIGINATASLPAGATAYAGALSIASGLSLTLTSGAAGSSLVLPNGTSFVLPDANETEGFIDTNGSGWTADASAAAAAGHTIVLNQPTTITLASGTTQVGTITGSAPLTLLTGANGGTLRLANGTVFTVPGANESETLSLANGAWTTDISAALAAGLPVVLNGTSTATLAAGTTHTGAISGSGTLAVTTGASAGTLVIGSQSFALPNAYETETLTLANGQWRVDVTSAIVNRQAIVLNGSESVELPAGYTYDNGAVSGTGSLLATSSAAGASDITLGGSFIALPDAHETVTLTQTSAGLWSEDVTAAVLANHNVTLDPTAPATLSLPSGATTYTGTLGGSGTLTLTSSATGPTAFVVGAQTFTLPSAGESETLSLMNGVWSVDVSAAILANKSILLNGGPATATLAAGTTYYSGAVSGTGSVTLASGSAGAATLVLADGTRFTLPGANQTATATLANGAWTLNVSASVLANNAITLSGVTVVSLPTGATTYTGTINGSGTLTISSSPYGASSFVVGSQTFTLPSPGESETLTIANGVVTGVDITAAVLASKNVVLAGATTLLLPANGAVDSGSITGRGTVTLKTGASGGSLTLADGTSFTLPDAGDTETATLANGAWTMNATAALGAGHAITVTGPTVATLTAGTTAITGLNGSGTLTLTSSSSGGAALAVANGTKIIIPGANQSVVVTMSNGVASVNVSSQIAANQNITLGSNATAFLPAGQSTYSGSITGSGTLTLFGSPQSASSITIAGTTYNVPADSVLALTETNGAFVPAATTDISAAIDVNQQSVVLTGGKYIIDVPAGQTVTYSGVVSGTGTFEVMGGGTLIVTNTNTVTLPANQQQESVTQVQTVEQYYDGMDLGRNNANAYLLTGQNNPVVTIDAGTTLDFGSPNGNSSDPTSVGTFADYVNVYANTYNLDNVAVNGTLGVYYDNGPYYGLSLGEISGTGVYQDGIGSEFIQGLNSFSGSIVDYGINFGGGFSTFQTPNTNVIFDTQILAVGTEGPTTAASNIVNLGQTFYSDGYTASILNQGFGLLIFTGTWSYTDDGGADRLHPSLSNPLLNYMDIGGKYGGDYNERDFVTDHLQQFGNGTNTKFFLPGNVYSAQIDFSNGGTVAFDYNGVVSIDDEIGDAYGPGTLANNGNLIIVGTVGNHIILTEQAEINGTTTIDNNAILQLGDGTVGVSYVRTVESSYGPVTGLYQTSGGNGALLTAESPSGAATDTIVDNGQLIVDNSNGAVDMIQPISLSNIVGTGSFMQEGTQLVTLLEDTTYTGETDIANGTLALGYNDGGTTIASSSGVVLQNAAAVFDISQAGSQSIQALTGAVGSTVALGGGTLTVNTASNSLFAGSLVGGGLGGGMGGGLTKTNGGTLELSGNSTYTGVTNVASGTLQLDGASLASRNVNVAAGALLTGSGTISGTVTGSGTIAAQRGTLTLGAVTGGESFEIGSGAALHLTSASSQVVTFEGLGTLTLDQAAAFTGTIDGFGLGDTIDLTGLAATGLSFSAATGVLSVLDGSAAVAQLRIDASAAGTTYALASDGHGGSVLTETATPAPTAPAGLTLNVSEDAYEGDAEFTISINGVVQNGVYTATALHSLGQSQPIFVPGSFGTGPINMALDFFNDAYGGSPSLDRNLYLNSITDNGTIQTENATFFSDGWQSFAVTGSTTYTIGTPDKIALQLSEDAYQGDAQFTVSVDGVQQGGAQTVTTLHSSGKTQEFDVTGQFGAGPHTVTVDFLNDAYAGTPTTDRNLYVASITYDGQTTVENAAQYSQGSQSYTGIGLGVQNLSAANTTLTSTGSDTINAGAGTDTINLDGFSAVLNGGSGTDVVTANGNDTIVANNAIITVTGGAGAMTFIGGSAQATVTAGGGFATVTAGSGGFNFAAGTGGEVINAGSGTDLISFLKGSAAGTALINSFTQGVDHIALKGYDAASVNQAINQATVSGGSTTIVLPDATKIVLAGITTVNQSSFLIG